MPPVEGLGFERDSARDPDAEHLLEQVSCVIFLKMRFT